MAKNVRVKMNSAGARALLNSPEVQAELLKYAQQAATAAGPGFEADVQPGKTRAHAMAKTTDIRSIRHNARTNALLKGLGGA